LVWNCIWPITSTANILNPCIPKKKNIWVLMLAVMFQIIVNKKVKGIQEVKWWIKFPSKFWNSLRCKIWYFRNCICYYDKYTPILRQMTQCVSKMIKNCSFLYRYWKQTSGFIKCENEPQICVAGCLKLLKTLLDHFFIDLGNTTNFNTELFQIYWHA